MSGLVAAIVVTALLSAYAKPMRDLKVTHKCVNAWELRATSHTTSFSLYGHDQVQRSGVN